MDEQRRHDGGSDSNIIKDSDYALVSDALVGNIQTNITSGTVNEEIESEYALLEEDTYNFTNVTRMSTHLVDTLNSNGAEESVQIQGECPIYSVVNKNLYSVVDKKRRVSTSSESSNGSAQDWRISSNDSWILWWIFAQTLNCITIINIISLNNVRNCFIENH